MAGTIEPNQLQVAVIVFPAEFEATLPDAFPFINTLLSEATMLFPEPFPVKKAVTLVELLAG